MTARRYGQHQIEPPQRIRRLQSLRRLESCQDARAVPAGAWTPAYDADRQVRPGAWLAERNVEPLRPIAGDAADLPQGAPASGRPAADPRLRRPPDPRLHPR